MMKNILRRLAILLLMAQLLSAASCAGSGDDNETTAAGTTAIETPQPEETDAIPAPTDLGGFTLRILNYDETFFNWANTQLNTEEQTGEVLNDAIYARTQKLEEYYNATIEETKSKEVPTVLKSTVLAGEDSFDMAMLFTPELATSFVNGYLLAWDELDAVDSTQPWWDAEATKLYNFGGFQAALSGAYSLYDYSTRHCYVFNKTMYDKLGNTENLYDLVRSGEWTVDKLYEIAATAVSDVNGDTVYDENDRYGITGSITRHYSALLAGSGVKYVDKDESGNFYFVPAKDEFATTVIQKLVSLNAGNTIYYNTFNNIGGYDYTLFPGGKILFVASYVNEVSQLRDMNDDIGILPAPKYNAEQEQYHSLVEGGAESVIPSTLDPDRYEAVGTLLNAWAYYSKTDVIPTYIEVILKNKVSRDTDSAEMLDLIFNTAFYDLGTDMWSKSAKNIYTSKIFLPKSDAIASVTASVETQLNAQIEKFEAEIDAYHQSK